MEAQRLESARIRYSRSLEPLAGPAALAIAYYLSAESAFFIGTLSDRIFAPFWPPNVILFCALLLTPRGRWWVLVAAVVPAHLIAELSIGMPWVPMLIAFLTNCSLALFSAILVQRFSRGPPWFGTIQKAAVFIGVTAGVAPAVVAFAGAFVPILTIQGGHIGNYWIHWSNWYGANALTALTMGPLLLTFLDPQSDRTWRAPVSRKLEAVFFLGALLLTTVASFVLSVQMAGSGFVPTILYLPLPIILWGSVRFGERGGSGAILVLAIASIWLTLNGPSPFFDVSPETSVLALQLFLIGIAVPVLLLASAVDQLKHEEQTTRALAGALLRAQDEERRRIARELHDGTGQNLIAAKMLAGGFKDALPESTQALFRQWEETVQQSIRELRTLSYLLHPPSLDEGGLQAALPTYVEGFSERSGITVDLHISPAIGRFSTDLELAFYRVVQEALANVHRHSGSASAQIFLDRQKKNSHHEAVLTIEDIGRGFSPAGKAIPAAGPSPPRGLGLESMRERIAQLGGSLEIESAPGRTAVTATVPLEGLLH
jgi:signal transduction histidine kinase